MAYLSLIRIPGDTEELLQGPYQRMSSNMSAVAPEHGLISHVAAKTDDGLLIVNLWESKEGSEAMARTPEVEQAREQSDIPRDAVRFEHYEVANVEIPR